VEGSVIKRIGVVLLFALALLFVNSAHAQTVAGSILGTAVDQSGAVVPGATVTLGDQAQGVTRNATTDANGVFRFPNLAPSTYTVTVNANGFKQSTTTGIELGTSEQRDLGKISLEVGAISQEVTVSAAVTPVQTSSSENSTDLTGSELNALPLRGRDLFGSIRLVPGVVDTNNGRDVTSPGAIGGITIDGNTAAKNFTVDGITDMDTGSNGTLHYEPNMDSIQEVKVLSSNYQAEFGRNSGGTITVVTKSGTQQFHGSGWWNHRHEGFNANDWFNKQNFDVTKPNQNIVPRQAYRYNVDGYSIGGPIYIPGHFNTERKHLFFFFSQEYTGQLATNSLQTKTVPTPIEYGVGTTAAECTTSTGVALGAGCADFSQTVTSSGAHLKLVDPTITTGNNSFPLNSAGICCLIPANRFAGQGVAMLQFFPLPNFTPTGSNANQYNFIAQAPGNHARRNDTLRVDVNPTSKLTAYFRYINDHDDMQALFNDISWIGNEPRGNGQSGNPVNFKDHPNPGHGYAGSAVWTISPTLVNEVTVGESWNTWSWYFDKASLLERSRNSQYNPGLDPPTLFGFNTTPEGVNGYDNLLPSFTFGSDLPNTVAYGGTGGVSGTDNYFNANTIWTFEDNLSKVVGNHQFKTGVYYETNTKLQPAGNLFAGNFNFGTDSNNPLNAGNGFANALLGYFDSYNQQSARTVFNVQYQNLEFYVQDNWRLTRRLTLDLGIRFYHQTPQVDTNKTFAEFNPSLYSASTLPRIYIPACTVASSVSSPCPAANLRSVDPANPGTFLPSSNIGAYVTGSGNYADGMVALGTNNPYTQSWLAPGPRIGFALDVFGNGKTALRGGFGVFFNRLDGNQVYGMSGQPPIAFTEADNQDSISNLTSSSGGPKFDVNNLTGVIAPGSVRFFGGEVPWDTVRNGSLGVQQDIGHNTVLDFSWVGNFGRHSAITKNLNPVPLGADFADQSSVTGKGLTQNGSVLERTVFPGWQDVTEEYFGGYSNYNAFDFSAQRRLSNGFLLGASYSYSKVLGVTSFDPLVPNNDARNYGPTSTDRRQNLIINYSYALPDFGKKLDSRVISAILGNWTFSGLSTFQSGPPITPTFSSSSGADISGSQNETPRPNYLGSGMNLSILSNCTTWNANPMGPGTKYVFNPCSYAPPAQGTAAGCSATCLGTEGVGQIYGKGLNNFDWTLEKRIPVGKNERRAFKIQVQAYNVFNHPQFNAWNSTATFSSVFCNDKSQPCGASNTNPLQVFSFAQNNKKFGQATGDTGPRIMSFNLRFEF